MACPQSHILCLISAEAPGGQNGGLCLARDTGNMFAKMWIWQHNTPPTTSVGALVYLLLQSGSCDYHPSSGGELLNFRGCKLLQKTWIFSVSLDVLMHWWLKLSSFVAVIDSEVHSAIWGP